MIIGIDVGGSTTKIVGIKDGCAYHPMFVTATDPVTSLFGAFGKYIYDHSIQLSEVEQVMLTGVGSSYIQQPLYGLPTARTDEFIANGLSAQYATGLDKLMVVSMGTGTSFVRVENDTICHVGGIGIGGRNTDGTFTFAAAYAGHSVGIGTGWERRLAECGFADTGYLPDLSSRVAAGCDGFFAGKTG